MFYVGSVLLLALLLPASSYSAGESPFVHSMALSGSAPAALARLNRNGVPFGGILVTAVVTAIGVALNAVVPSSAFEIALNLSALGIISAWAVIVLCQLRLWQLAKRGELERPAFRMMGAPWTGLATLVFLAAVLVLMALDRPVGTWTVASIGLIAPALVMGWFCCRGRIAAIQAGLAGPAAPADDRGEGTA